MAAQKKNLSSVEFAQLSEAEQAKYEGNKPERNQYLNKSYRSSLKRKLENGDVTKWYPQFSQNETFGQKLIIQPSYNSEGKLVTVTPKEGHNKGVECVWLNIMQDKSETNLYKLNRAVELKQEMPPVVSPYFETHNEARVTDGKVHYFESHNVMYPKETFDKIVEAAGDNHCRIDSYTIAQDKDGKDVSFELNGDIYGIYAPCNDCKKNGGNPYYKLITENRHGISELNASNNKLTPEKFQNQINYANMVKQNLIERQIAQKDMVVTNSYTPATLTQDNTPVKEAAHEDMQVGDVSI